MSTPGGALQAAGIASQGQGGASSDQDASLGFPRAYAEEAARREEELIARVVSLLSAPALQGREWRARIEGAENALGAVWTPSGKKRIRSLARGHPDAEVRRMLLRVVTSELPGEPAAELVVDLIHDSDDIVAFAAIRLAGRHRLRRAAPDLARICGPPSATLHSSGKPVGVGAALCTESLLQIIGSHDYQEIVRREPDVLGGTREDPGLGGSGPAAVPAPYPFPPAVFRRDAWQRRQTGWYMSISAQAGTAAVEASSSRNTPPGQDDVFVGRDGKEMVGVPAGPFTLGLGLDRLPSRRFVWSDYAPAERVRLEEFFIDRFPVTNAEYDRFVSDVDAHGHRHAHADEPPGKDHRRNTVHDHRFGPDHPAVGVDWYDAHAYCRWAGKRLPSEQEWEKAARGSDGRLYPWGNRWDPRLVTYAETVWGFGMPTVTIWRDNLRELSDDWPPTLTAPVTAHPGNASPYGAREMIGNVWEWTRTNFYTGEAMDPSFRGSESTDFMNDRRAFVAIRGGAWSSIPEMLTAPYRGKDLLTDRHNEIGFRCARGGDDGSSP